MQRFVAPSQDSLVSTIVPLSLNENFYHVGNLERFALNNMIPNNHIIRYYDKPQNLRQLHESIADKIEEVKNNFRQINYSTKLTKKEIFLYIPLILAGLAPSAIPFIGDEINGFLEKLSDVGGAIGGSTAFLASPASVMKGYSVGKKLFSSIPFLAGTYGLVKTRVKKNIAARDAEIENEFRNNVCENLGSIADDVRYQVPKANIYLFNELFIDEIDKILNGNFVQPKAVPDKFSYRTFKAIASDPELMNKADYSMQRYFRKKVEMFEEKTRRD